MVKKNLAEQFIAELGDQELWPTMYNCAPLVQTSGWTSRKYYEKFYKNQLSFPLLISIKNDIGLMNIPITKPKQLAEEVLENFLSDINYLKKIKEQCLKYERSIVQQYEKLTDNYFATTSQEKIILVLKDLCDTVWEYNASVFFSTAFDRETLENVLKKRHQIITDDFWQQASQPPVVSFERRHGWYLVEHIDIPSKELLEKCQYFFAAYNNVPSIIEVEDLLQQNYKDYFGSDGKERMVLEKTNFEKQQSIYKNWSVLLSVDEIQLAKFIHQTIEFRDVRKDYLLMATTIIFRAAKSFLQKVNLPEVLAGYLLFDELFCDEEYFKEHSEEIKNRINGFDVFCNYEGEHFVEYGQYEENQKIIENLRSKKTKIINQETEIFGQIGSSGKVVGRVRKILNISANHVNFNEGEILVAGMTRPEYVPFMKKAAAIITDEGGITCHAAIVARELKKPCIIGTKTATKVLHDGDLIEVDADNGVVKVLKKEDQIKKEIFDEDWTKVWTTEYSLFSVWMFGRSFADICWQEVGAGFSKIIFLIEGPLATVFRLDKEQKEFAKKMASRFLFEENFLDKAVKLMSDIQVEFEKFFEMSEQEILTPEKWLRFLEIHRLYQPYFLGVLWAPNELGNFNAPTDLYEKIFAVCESTRKRSESIFPLLEKFLQKLFKFIAVKEKINENFLRAILPEELVAYINGQGLPDEKILKSRYDYSVVLATKNKNELLLNMGARQLIEGISKINTEGINEIKGTIANHGVAKGKVRLVFMEQDLNKVQAGDIIVTTMTRPEWVSAMKFAGAYVTDAGSVLCHAAIVSREFNKPCIINTKIATKVLHDGDFVEVDADNGIVRKL